MTATETRQPRVGMEDAARGAHRAMIHFDNAVSRLALDPLPGNPVPGAVVAGAEEQLGEEGLAAAAWAIVAINPWNRIAIASHLEAGTYQPGG
jgi:hypothetical protein